MAWFLVFGTVFLALFTQSLAGFGLALVSMPILSLVLGVQTAAPLVAVFAPLAELALLIAYRQALSLRVVWQLAAASVIGVPVGVIGLRRLDERLVLVVLGVVIAGYALYTLLDLRLPNTQGTLWAWSAGLIAGVLGGAYNTSGPPVIIFGHSRRWPPPEFKANLQGFFVLNSVVILASHLLAGTTTTRVWSYSLVSFPAAALGIWAGLQMAKRLDPHKFSRLVLWLLLILGLSLLFG